MCPHASMCTCVCVCMLRILTDIAFGWTEDKGQREEEEGGRERIKTGIMLKEGERESVCACYIAGSGPWRRRKSRLSREDSMAASGPSQAKDTAKENSGGERIEDMSKDKEEKEVVGRT